MNKVLLLLLVALALSQTTIDVVQVQKTASDKMMEEELLQSQLIHINYDHIQTYATTLKPLVPEYFTLAPAEDHVVKGSFSTYTSANGIYAKTSFIKGEEVYFQVMEDGQVSILQKQCYHQLSFEFQARQGHKYILRFITTGTQKAVVLALQNFVSTGQIQEVLKSEHVGEHANRTKSIKEDLISYFDVIERQSLFTDRISRQVQSQTSRFLLYQWFEMLLVLGAAVAQVYFVRKMLTHNSII